MALRTDMLVVPEGATIDDEHQSTAVKKRTGGRFHRPACTLRARYVRRIVIDRRFDEASAEAAHENAKAFHDKCGSAT
jgi:hypothetical protein